MSATDVGSGSTKKRGNSKPNVKRRGDTYTYYLYVTDHLGQRKQHSKGGYKTQREAEDARVSALAALQTGSYVKAKKQTVAEFLMKEWLPSRRPPVLEESTWVSYDRYIRLHVLPWIGVVPLQQLSPVDLNGLYRRLLDSDRKRPGLPKRHPTELHTRAHALRADGLTCQQVAESLQAEFPAVAGDMTRFAVAALLRRGAPKSYASDAQPGLSARTVRYIHTILHAALKDALRWNRVVRNVADAATPPSTTAAKAPQTEAWTADPAAIVSPVDGREPLSPGLAVPGDERVPSRRGARPPMERRRSRCGHGGDWPSGHRGGGPRCAEGATQDEARPRDPPRYRNCRDASST